jgi:hypothetical protein
MFTPEVIEQVGALYREDFEAFGYTDVVPPKLDPKDEYPAAALGEITRLVERHERISDLALRAQALSRRATTSRAAKALPPVHGVRAVLGRVRRRLS